LDRTELTHCIEGVNVISLKMDRQSYRLKTNNRLHKLKKRILVCTNAHQKGTYKMKDDLIELLGDVKAVITYPAMINYT
jgi:chromosomal replication initiation ATPase DnaA